jgi:hypothetical protein
MRFNSFYAALLFAIAAVAGAGAIMWWGIVFARKRGVSGASGTRAARSC